MVETIGNKLQRARLEKKIALEDAAYATKIHAARLSDIETDVYTNFPNIAYAKGFLQIYSNYLGVDAQPYLSAFEDANTFGLDDYQYLSDVPIAQFRAQRRAGGLGGGGGGRSPRHRHRRSRRVLTVAIALVTLALGGFAWYLVLSFQRLGNLDQLASRSNGGGSNGTSSAVVSPGEKKGAPLPVAENEKRAAASAPAGDAVKAPGVTTFERDAAISTISGINSNPATAPIHSRLPNTLTALPEEGPFAAALVPSLGGSDLSAATKPSATAATPAEASGESTPEPVVRVALPVVPTPRSSTANHASNTDTAVRR